MDALPYVDIISSEETKRVEALIAQEVSPVSNSRNKTISATRANQCERSEKKPKDYLKEMPNLGQPLFGGSTLLQEEYKRVKNGQPKAAVNSHRFTLPIPSIKEQNDPEAWKRALENAQAQLEHQRLRALNLELALKYAPETWKQANEESSRVNSDYQEEVQRVKDEIVDINKRRKLTQTEAGAQLAKLEKEWRELVMKNFEILQECDKKRNEIEQLRAEVSKKRKSSE